jgi:hypothetical protein
MEADMDERTEALSHRVQALERQGRRQRAAVAAGLVMVAGAALASGQGRRPAAPAELQARRFVLVSAAGTPMAALEATAEGTPRLALLAHDGVARLSLALAGTGSPSIVLTDAVGGPRVALEAKVEESRISVLGLGKTAVTLANGGVAPRVALSDSAGNDRVWLAVRLDSPVLQFLDAHGFARTGLTSFNDDTGLAVVSETDRSRPGLVLLGKDRTVVWSAP